MTPTEAALCLAAAVLFALVAYRIVDWACHPRCPECRSDLTRQSVALGGLELWMCERCNCHWLVRQK